MSDINEQRQIAYMELIKALLQCPPGEEDPILVKSSELVDEELVMALLATAEMLVDRQDPEENSTIEWLVDFAGELAQKLGLDIAKTQDVSADEDFVIELLEAVENSNGDEQLHQFFDNNLDRLNENLLTIFPHQIELLLEIQDNLEWKSLVGSMVETLGNRFQDFPRGDRRLNLEFSIACYDRALLEYTRAKLPLEWAMTQMNRANVYCDRIEGDKGENLEAAIRGYDRALLEYTREKLPLEWAMTQMNRAIVYRNRIEGDKRENLEEAIRGYDRALLEFTRQKLPLEWAKIQMNRANIYCDRIEGNRGENLEAAFRGYDRALLERTREKFPLDWATTQMNRAIVYQHRIEGDRGENLQAAIRGYELALLEYTREKFPLDWATTTENLAILHTQLRILPS